MYVLHAPRHSRGGLVDAESPGVAAKLFCDGVESLLQQLLSTRFRGQEISSACQGLRLATCQLLQTFQSQLKRGIGCGLGPARIILRLRVRWNSQSLVVLIHGVQYISGS